MTPEFFRDFALKPALQLLPPAMGTQAGQALTIAVCLQESHLQNRVQMGGGPARSYAQFELGGGVRGVLNHALSKPHAQRLLAMLDYDPASDPASVHLAMTHNDVLTAGLARLLLYTSPEALPGRDRPDRGWFIYQSVWRPGRPHRETWDAYFADAWRLIT